MLHRLFITLLVLLLPTAAFAQSIEGTWDFRVEGTTIFRFDIEEGTGGEWHGSWRRPETFNTDGDVFTNLSGGIKATSSMTGIEFLGLVELSFDDPRPGAIPDIFRFKLLDAARAEMTYVGTDLAPYQLVRARDADLMGNWDMMRVYRRRLPAEGEDELMRVRDVAPPSPHALTLPDEEAARLEVEIPEAETIVEAEVEEQAEDEFPRIGADFLDGF